MADQKTSVAIIGSEGGLGRLLCESLRERYVEGLEPIVFGTKLQRQSTEDQFQIKADIYVDCTGDERLGVEAGAEYRVGRESKEEFGEIDALDVADLKSLGSSLLFEANEQSKATHFTVPDWARKFTDQLLTARKHDTFNYGYWWLEWGGQLNTIKDNSVIKHELLSILLGVWDHIKNSGEHDAEKWALSWLGFVPGKRESRRFKGLHTFTQNDAVNATFFFDTIAYGGWFLDTHPVDGIDAVDTNPCSQPKPPYLYGVPLRICISQNIQIIMFAGRNVSASHLGFSTLRVMATCAVVGQAVGTAAAICSAKEILPKDVLNEKTILTKLQNSLIEDGCLLPEIRYSGDDIAREATITCSSFIDGGNSENIISGMDRSAHGKDGLHPRNNCHGTHRWMSDPAEGLPAWIELSWNEKVQINCLKLILDTRRNYESQIFRLGA